MTRRFSSALLVVAFLSLTGWAQNPYKPSGGIRGQVRLADGRPAPVGIAVYLEMRGGGGAAGQTQTDQSGKFEFPQLQQAIYEVHIRAIGYQEDFQEVNLNQMPQGYVTFVLRPDPTSKPPAVPPGGAGATLSAVDAAAPESARKDFNSGSELLQSGKDFDKGIELLKKATKEYPQYSEAYVVMGVAYSSRQNWSDADQALQAAIKANDKNAAAYLTLGLVKNETKNYDDALKYLLKATELAPESPDAHFQLGRTYYATQKWQLADEELAKANHLRPENPEQHVYMGNVQLRERNAEGALKEFQEAVRLDPQGPLAAPTQQMIARIETALQHNQPQAGRQQ